MAPTANLSMIAASLFSVNALHRWSVKNVPLTKIAFAGLVANVEFDAQGKPRTKIFYCNASAPYQKGSCENNHEMIRRVIPKGVDIGQYTQEQIDLMMSHINSYTRKKLGNKSPYEMFEFQYGKTLLDVFHLKKIPADKIILSPELLK